MSFENLSLIEPIQRALKTEGYTKPTPIQEKAIPIVLKQRDLLGCAQTGTGKTAAFAIPMLQLLHGYKQENPQDTSIKALILTPTRELAIQIDESFGAYGRHTGLRHTVIFGGVKQRAQTDALNQKPDILVATPGRLLDLMNQGFINLQRIKIFVLDEADRMLDMGFIHDVKKVLTKLPAKRQTLFFSATMPPEIVKLSDTILTNPEKVEVTPVSSTANTIQQQVYFVGKKDKKDLLNDLLQNRAISSVLVFTRTKHGANKVVKDLLKEGTTAEAIHGNKSQNARQLALSNFKAGKTRVLVATDIAARGIDIDELSHVINYELPNISETYVHRIGRTGRAGASGIAISFCDSEEKAYLRDIQKLIGKQIPVVSDHPYTAGADAPVEPSQTQQRRGGFGGGQRSGQGRSDGSRSDGSRSSSAPRRSEGGSGGSSYRSGSASSSAGSGAPRTGSRNRGWSGNRTNNKPQ
jgi:ATP-dependent RNA helicase RhlE